MTTRFVLALLVAGCGSREPQTHHISMRAMQYSPAELAVAVGDTIVWTNTDILPHTVTSVPPSPLTFDSQRMEAKQEWTYKVTAAGDLTYVCTYHPTMRGIVIAR